MHQTLARGVLVTLLSHSNLPPARSFNRPMIAVNAPSRRRVEQASPRNGSLSMLDHTGIVVTDLAKARRFYDAIAKPLGLMTADNFEGSFLLGKGPTEYPYLWIGTLIPSYWVKGSRAGINQMHVAFAAPSKPAVHDFYDTALKNGGKDNGTPGPREGAENYYGAFVLDPDGNNIEAVWRE